MLKWPSEGTDLFRKIHTFFRVCNIYEVVTYANDVMTSIVDKKLKMYICESTQTLTR